MPLLKVRSSHMQIHLSHPGSCYWGRLTGSQLSFFLGRRKPGANLKPRVPSTTPHPTHHPAPPILSPASHFLTQPPCTLGAPNGSTVIPRQSDHHDLEHPLLRWVLLPKKRIASTTTRRSRDFSKTRSFFESLCLRFYHSLFEPP